MCGTVAAGVVNLWTLVPGFRTGKAMELMDASYPYRGPAVKRVDLYLDTKAARLTVLSYSESIDVFYGHHIFDFQDVEVLYLLLVTILPTDLTPFRI